MPDASDLADCGRRPNCVSSNASNPRRRVGPWPLAVEQAVAWPVVREVVAQTPRTEIVQESEGYLHAEARSRIFGFVDDLEVALNDDGTSLGVRSASRLGYSDRGVNRRRLERLRRALVERRILEP